MSSESGWGSPVVPWLPEQELERPAPGRCARSGSGAPAPAAEVDHPALDAEVRSRRARTRSWVRAHARSSQGDSCTAARATRVNL
jgi:hypothetical protein